jgi:hypothetical protein
VLRDISGRITFVRSFAELFGSAVISITLHATVGNVGMEFILEMSMEILSIFIMLWLLD